MKRSIHRTHSHVTDKAMVLSAEQMEVLESVVIIYRSALANSAVTQDPVHSSCAMAKLHAMDQAETEIAKRFKVSFDTTINKR